MKSKREQILVTGGAGFIGSHVVDCLVRDGHDVVVLDDLSGGYESNVHRKAKFIKGSITDHALVAKVFDKYQFDYVFHLAAYAAEGLSHFIRRFNYTNNLIGSANIINESVKHKVKCLVFTSSIAVYGANQYPMIESMKPEPEDPYGIAKYAVEMDLESARRLFGLNYIIFRPHNVYGERQNIGDKYRNVIGIFMNNLLQKKSMPIFGDGTQMRAFTYIEDVSSVIAKSIKVRNAYNEIFNIGADTPYTVNDLAAAVAVSIGLPANVTYLPARDEVKIAYSDHTKARKIFGKNKTTSLIQGMNKMAKWVRKEGSRKTKKFRNIEIKDGLPPSWR